MVGSIGCLRCVSLKVGSNLASISLFQKVNLALEADINSRKLLSVTIWVLVLRERCQHRVGFCEAACSQRLASILMLSLRSLLGHHGHRYVGVVDLFEVLFRGEPGASCHLRTSLLDGVIATDTVLALRCVSCGGLLYAMVLPHHGVDRKVVLFNAQGTERHLLFVGIGRVDAGSTFYRRHRVILTSRSIHIGLV